jgi:hypothetical protein
LNVFSSAPEILASEADDQVYVLPAKAPSGDRAGQEGGDASITLFGSCKNRYHLTDVQLVGESRLMDEIREDRHARIPFVRDIGYGGQSSFRANE